MNYIVSDKKIKINSFFPYELILLNCKQKDPMQSNKPLQIKLLCHMFGFIGGINKYQIVC